jgi:hypothetical protein
VDLTPLDLVRLLARDLYGDLDDPLDADALQGTGEGQKPGPDAHRLQGFLQPLAFLDLSRVGDPHGPQKGPLVRQRVEFGGCTAIQVVVPILEAAELTA